MSSFPQLVPASVPFGAILSAQIIPYTIKFQHPPVYNREIDNKILIDILIDNNY